MTDHPSPARQTTRRMTRDQAAMLVVTISVGAILGSMVLLGVMALPEETAEATPEPEPVTSAVGSADPASDAPEPALEYTTTEVVDPETPEGVAALWHEAHVNVDFEGLEPLTCAYPASIVSERLLYAEASEPQDDDYTIPDLYMTSREHEGGVEVAIFMIADEPTYDYIWEKEARPGDIITIMTVVDEDGEWKVCDVASY